MPSAPTFSDLPPSLRQALAKARSLGVITGAGVSKESGIPTYRGKGGIYDDPEEGDRTVEALSGPTLERDPDRTWRVIADLARLARGAEPGPAHHAIAAIERKVERFILLTQNVDGLHQRAGSRRVIDIHGDVFGTICLTCHARGRLDRPDGLDALTGVPRCPECDGPLRPDVVLFGESLSMAKYLHVQTEFVALTPDVVVIAGTSALFPYIVEPVLHARRQGKPTVEVNTEDTELSEYVEHRLRGPAGEILPRIAEAIAKGTN